MNMHNDYLYRVRVYYEDTDAAGVVYYANYLKWMERARTEWLNAQGLSLAELKRQGCVFAVYRVEVTYKKPARLEEVVSVSCEVINVGMGRLKIRQRVERYGKLLVEGVVELAVVDPVEFRPTRLPAEIRERLKRSIRPEDAAEDAVESDPSPAATSSSADNY